MVASPFWILVDAALIETLGRTVTVTLPEALPPAPEQEMAKVVSAVRLPEDNEPEVPLPKAEPALVTLQEEVLVELQVIVVAVLYSTILLAALMEAVGIILTVTLLEALPPAPEQEIENVVADVRAPEDNEPEVPLPKAEPALVTLQDVVSVELHEIVVELPEEIGLEAALMVAVGTLVTTT